MHCLMQVSEREKERVQTINHQFKKATWFMASDGERERDGISGVFNSEQALSAL